MQTRVRPDPAPSKHNFYDEFLNFSKLPPDQFTENDFITTHIFRRNYLQENCLMSKRISALGFYILQTWINPGWVSFLCSLPSLFLFSLYYPRQPFVVSLSIDFFYILLIDADVKFNACYWTNKRSFSAAVQQYYFISQLLEKLQILLNSI